MPTTAQLRTRLISKLKELFQLDQPDLDFGFYRIMHAKAEQVERFIDNDLLKIVDDAFAGSDKEKTESALDTAKRKLVEAMGEDALQADGTVNPAFANTPAGKAYTEAAAKAGNQVSSLSDEGQVYDHLFRFFERYYDNGDFVSRRYYTRETDGRAAPFAIPYNGEEVKLHWANADQYYIKTAEYFNNYTFDLTQAAEIRDMNVLERAGSGVPDKPVKVHFKIVEASEGEHGNIKAKDDDKRFFIIHGDQPIAFDENGALVVHFEYRADPEKGSKQEGSWRDHRNAEAVEVILKALEAAKGDNPTAATCLQLFKAAAPTETDKKRPLLAKYLNQYTARNTMDYFIHKNLGGFLRRELDFYIKNEVMRLDDLDQADAPAVEGYLSKLKVLRKIAHKLIDFLAQLEDFQKKLWLKKKFVVETNYCITLDRVPEDLYAEIAVNDAQREEWLKLFAIDEIDASKVSLGYAEPLTIDFLKANDKLVIDTKFFDAGFKERLLGAIEDFDAQCDAEAINADSFQAEAVLSECLREQIDSVYIDPPYNTGQDGFSYKDSYQHASWITFMTQNLLRIRKLLKSNGTLFCSIGNHEVSNLMHTGREVFGKDNHFASLCWKARVKPVNIGDAKLRPQKENEFVLGYEREKGKALGYPILSGSERSYPHIIEGRKYRTATILKSNRGANRRDTMTFEIDGYSPPEGQRWQGGYDFIRQLHDDGYIEYNEGTPMRRYFEDEETSEHDPFYCYVDNELSGTSEGGKNRLNHQVGNQHGFDTVKPIELIQYIVKATCSKEGVVADFFAGTGTTGDAVINIDREQLVFSKMYLAEIGSHFYSTLIPRLKKSIYSPDWKEGKPTSRDSGISHCFKYIRLESYEDTLNNLTFDDDAKRSETLSRSPALKEDYMLRYLLNVETRSSQSLLNIDAFADPTAYHLSVKRPGSDEQETLHVDLIETFNYLIGLRVTHYAAPQSFSASFKREPDPELPEDQHTKLIVDGAIKQDADGPWWFRKVEGWVPKNPSVPDYETREKNPQNMERILIVWRKLTGDLEQDNLMLDVWFRKHAISTQDYEYDTIYVNGSNNLPNLKQDDEHWKVRLIEEEFMKRMWDTSDA